MFNESASKPGSLVPSECDLSLSVVISTCDRQATLEALLAALEKQSFQLFEVVVVVGPTHDGTREFLQRRYGDRLTVLDCPAFNLSVSRDLGLCHAAGDLVAFIDDDAIPSDTWLEQLVAAYSPEVDGVGGTTYLARSGVGSIQFRRGVVTALGYQQDVRSEGSALRSESSRWHPRFHGTNMSYRWDALASINGFDERFEYLHDDADIGIRLSRNNSELVHLDDALVYHAGAEGRNRGGDPYDLNWHSWARSTLYFTMKNGPLENGWPTTMAVALRHLSHFRAQISELVDKGLVGAERAARARRAVLLGGVSGILRGFLPRRLNILKRTERELIVFPSAEGRQRAYPIPSGAPSTRKSAQSTMHLDQPPLRIALLSADYPPASTEGVARSTQTLARGLTALGHQVHVIAAGTKDTVLSAEEGWIRTVRPRHFPRYGKLAERGAPNVAARLCFAHSAHAEVERLVVNHRIQVVDSPLWGLDGLVAALAEDVPVIVRAVTAMRQIAEIHGKVNDETKLFGVLEEELLSRARLVVSNSEATALTIAEVYEFSANSSNHAVVSYGMVPGPDPDFANPGTQDVSVLFVGRLEKRKGILDLFDAIKRVLANAPNCRFDIVGSDNSAHDGFHADTGYSYPEWFARNYANLESQVTFHGFVADEELPAMYEACDIFVAPSHYESFGLIYLEAMNAGKPVVACAAGGPAEIVVQGETGFLVQPGDSEELSNAIQRLLEDPSLRLEMGKAGRARLLARFTHTQMAQGFVDAYRSVL